MELKRYQHATIGSISAKLSASLASRFNELTFTAHGKHLQATDLLIEKGIRSLDTVRVSARLPGGSNGDKGEKVLLEI